MCSAQRMVDMQRQDAIYLSQSEYCSAPPIGLELVHVCTTEKYATFANTIEKMQIVIPGDTLVPKALRNLQVFDEIRREHRVWITREENSETCFDVSATHTKPLHVALNAINQKIHDMRLSEESLTAHYFVQSPEGDKESTIGYEIGKRPVVKGAKNNSHYSKYMLDALVIQFAAALPPALKTLKFLRYLTMHVDFGHLNISAKPKTAGKRLSVEEFSRALNLYSSRGRGATIQTEMPNLEVANELLSSLISHSEISKENAEATLTHHVQFEVDKQTVSADLLDREGSVMATSSKCTQTEGHPPLDWIVSAPATYMDWNLRVDSRPNLVGDRSGQLSEATANFVHSFIFKIDGEDCAETDTPSKEADGPPRRFKLPRWQTAAHGNLAQVSSNFRTKSCARLQYRDTPYEIQLSITQHWAKLPVSAKPDRLSWSVSVSSIHWEEALSECKSNESSREFEGALLNRLWPGEGSLKERLKEFLECVFSIQTAIVELQS
ncbi:hypothetical protein BBAD15_g7119 [Beauveria bassiana D1-5]|uniref:Uncharacterized protein n=1 Tax=Beauveria bassiana D1-5 TaxID=1245745 RepID=A0A0A2VJ12_BEABA|nr:hypothetical protein BBAD15_g7119 [Beauveria bassiana D1-5]